MVCNFGKYVDMFLMLLVKLTVLVTIARLYLVVAVELL